MISAQAYSDISLSDNSGNQYKLRNDAGVPAEMKATMGITPESVKMATMIVTTAPIVFIYPFLQKYFVKGMMIGSIKG